MARQVEMVITADNTKALRAFQKLIDKGVQTGQSLEKAGNKGKDSFQKAGNALTGGISKAITMITGAGGLLAVVKLVSDEFRNMQEMQTKMADVQVTLDTARQNLIWNMAGQEDKVKGTIESLKKLAAETGVTETTLTSAMATAVSAGGDPQGLGFDAVRAAARLRPSAPEDIPMITGSILDLAKLTGSQDAMTNAGLLRYVGKEARITDPMAQAMNIPAALIGTGLAGASTQESAALFGTITKQAADPVGRKSGTAAISLAVQMKEFFEGAPEKAEEFQAKMDKKRKRKWDADVSEERRAMKFWESVPETEGFGERLDILQQNPTVRKEFLKTASFQAKTGEVVKALISDPESITAKEYKGILGRMPTDMSGMAAVAEEAITAQGLSDLNVVSGFGRDFRSMRELVQTVNPFQGLWGQVHKELPETLQAAGMSALGQRISKLGTAFSSYSDVSGALGKARGAINERYGEFQKEMMETIDPETGTPGTMEGRMAYRNMNFMLDLMNKIDERMKTANEIASNIMGNTDDPKVTKTPSSRKEVQ